jgi:hypothetical protein
MSCAWAVDADTSHVTKVARTTSDILFLFKIPTKGKRSKQAKSNFRRSCYADLVVTGNRNVKTGHRPDREKRT